MIEAETCALPFYKRS